MNWWESIKNYYLALGEKYSVDPILFVGIHIVATPLFAAAVLWILYNVKKNRSIIWPGICAALIFNAANIYLIIKGRHIPWWIYGLVITTTILSSYVTVKRINKRIHAIHQ